MDRMINDNLALQQEGTLGHDALEASGFSANSLELLEQHQAKEQARLLQRFKELREWQQQQQQQLMMQQQQQLSSLQNEQSKVQSLHTSKHLNGSRAARPNAARSMSPIMTPPCKPRPGVKTSNQEPVGNSMTAGISVDSGLVSMQDTLKSQMSTLPKPVMYIDPSKSNNLPDEDKYTNSDLFSNPGCRDDVDDEFDNMVASGKYSRNYGDGGPPVPDWMSDTSEFVPPKLPPPRPMRGGVSAQSIGMKLGKNVSAADQLAGLEQLLTTAPAGLLQKMLTLLPKTTDSISSDAPPMKRIVENSASPTLTGPSKRPLQQQMQQQMQYQKEQSHHQYPQVAHPQQQFYQPHQSQEKQSNTQVAFNLDAANFYQPQQPLAYGIHNITAQDIMQLSFQDASQAQDTQYIPRAFYMDGSDGGSRSLSNEVLEEEVDDDGFNDDVVEEDEEQGFDEQDEDIESQNNTAKEVIVDKEDDERPIGGIGGTKSFERLLEEKLMEEEEEREQLLQMQSDAETNPTTRPRKFLRRGEGIARFNSAPKKPKKPPPKRQEKRSSGGVGRSVESDSVTKTQSHPASLDKGKNATETNRQNKEKNSVGARLKSMASRKVSAKDGKYDSKAAKPGVSESKIPTSPPAKLNLIRSAANRKLDEQRFRQKEENNGDWNRNEMVNGMLEKKPKNLMHSVDQSPSSRSMDDPDSTELDSLAEFEILEDAADNMSFCSNSSIVRKLICSDGKDHQDAIKKLHAIAEDRKHREGKAAPPSSAPMTSNKKSNSKTGQEDNSSSNLLQNANSNNNNISNYFSTNNNFHNAFESNPHTFKSSKIDNIIMAKPTDHCSSSDVTLTESSSEEDDDDTAVERSIDNKFGQQNDPFAEIKKKGFFSQSGDQHHNFSKPTLAGQSCENPEIPALSPNKPITRKVASLSSKVNSANDTLAMLQALSKKAGFLVSDTNGTNFASSSEANFQNTNGIQAYNVESLGTDFSQNVSVNGMPNKGLSDFNMQSNGHVKGQSFKSKDYNSQHYGIDEEDHDDDSDKDDDEDNFNMEKNEIFQSENGRPRDVKGNRSSSEEKSAVITNGFDDEAEWIDDDDEADDDENNPLAHRSNSSTARLEASNNPPATPPTSKLVTKLFPKLKPPVTKQINPPPSRPSDDSEATSAAPPPVDGITSRVLRDKLMELEVEIERFRSENSNLDRLRREREEGLAKLKQQIETFEREKESELKRLEEFKMEEMKKLKRERKLFDTYQKKVRSMPDKKEREEIENLKGQLEEAQDELRRKESRWNSSTSRLKNRLAEVELENGELKEEVRILEKKRLEWLTAQSQAKSTSSSSLLLTHGKAREDVKPQNQDPIPSSRQRSSTPTKDDRPSISGSIHGKKPIPISLRTSVPAVTASSNAPKNSRQPKSASGKALKPSSVAGVAASGDITAMTPAATSSSQPTLRTSGESLPTQNNLVPVMMETSPFAQIMTNGQSVPSSTAVGTIAPSSSLSPHDNKSAAMQAMEKAVIEKGSPMDFVENVHSDGKVEKLYKNGAKEVKFPNGTIKEISVDGQTIVCRLANGDIRQIFPDHRVIYIFSEAQIMQTTFPDGLETFQFKNGQVERRYPDSTVEITFPSKDVKYIFPDGAQEVRLTDGTTMTYNTQGERTVEYPSGDREVHTAEYQRREFPDGIVKTVYADGRHETRFPNGRVRMRDKSGNVIMDQICYR